MPWSRSLTSAFDSTPLIATDMRILDRYIIRNFLSTFFLMMVALFCVVAVVFDVAENLRAAH